MDNKLLSLILIIFGASVVLTSWATKIKRDRRRNYYRNEYLKSEEWRRKRYVVLKRDNWRCVYCGEPATQVHHKRYAKYYIGMEPIEWLVSICQACHGKMHN